MKKLAARAFWISIVAGVAIWQEWQVEWVFIVVVSLVPVWALNVWASQYLISYYNERRSPDGEAGRLCAGGQRIQAIKLLREHHGWTLKEAKEYCDGKWPGQAS